MIKKVFEILAHLNPQSSFGIFISVCGLILLIGVSQSFGQILVTNETGFVQASWGSSYGSLEDVSTPDNGGVAYFFVSNENTAQPDAITQVRFHVAGTYYEPEGMRIWPPVMNAKGQGNNISTVTVKGLTSPFKEGHAVTMEVETSNGHSYVLPYTLFATPELRIGNVLISHSGNDLYVYLRNTSTTNTYQINQLLMNELQYTIGASSGIEIVGGNNLISPKQIGIIKITNPFPLNICYPLALRINATNTTTQSQIWASAGIRLTETEFPLGTWSSSLFNPDQENYVKKIRSIALNSNHGPGEPANMQYAANDYFMRTVWEPNFGDPMNPANAIPVIQAHSQANYVHVWSVDDEPDLHSKPIAEELQKNQTYWENDPNTPSYVNLCTQKKYQRYGWMTDVVAMDHYAAADAPNVIPMTWTPVVGRTGKIEEAISYTEYLKFNTEPRRMWAWCQLASSVWGVQPKDYSVNYQFWAHVMCGAKGIHWFCVKQTTDEDYTEQWNESVKLTNQINQIKNLCLFGEMADVVTRSTTNVKSRALIGEDAMVVVVVNNNIDFSYNVLQLKWNSSISNQDYWIEVTVPEWIPVEQIYRVSASGKITDNGVQHMGGRTYRINTPDNIYKESHVFVIGKNDITPPETPSPVIISDNPNSNNYTFSWEEPWDNTGVMGYYVYRNGSLIADVRGPVYDVVNGPDICENAIWTFVAYDNSGNLSAPAVYTMSAPSAATSVSLSPESSCPGQSVTVAPIGGDSGAGGEWHWYKYNCDTNNGGIYLGSGNSMAITPESSLTQYAVMASSQCGSSGCFNFTIPASSTPVDAAISASETQICLGESVNISIQGGTGDPVYFCSDNGGVSWNIFSMAHEGESNFSFTPDHEGSFLVHVRNRNHCGFCWDYGTEACTAFQAVEIQVLPALSVSMSRTPTGPQCSGTQYNFYAHPAGGSGSYSYQWYLNGEQQSSTTDVFTTGLSNTQDWAITHNITVVVSDGICTASAIMTPTVYAYPSDAQAIIGNSGICPGQTELSYSIPEISFANNYIWTLPTGATGSSNTNSITVNFDENFVGGVIEVLGQNTCGTGDTAQLEIYVEETPIDATISSSQSAVCLGESIEITSSGGTGIAVYFCSDNGGNSWNVFSNAYQGLNSFTFTPEHAGTYRFHVRNMNNCGFCWDFGTEACTAFNYIDVTVNEPFTVSMTRIPTGPQCSGTAYVFYAHVTGGSGNVEYNWFVNGDMQNSHEDNLQISLFNNSAQPTTPNVTVEVIDGACSGSAFMTPTINPNPAAAENIEGNLFVCEAQSNLIYSTPPIAAATSYEWLLPQGFTGFSTSNSISLNISLGANSGILQVRGVNNCGEGEFSSVLINVNQIPETPIITLIGNVLSSNYSEGNQWYNQNGLITGATNQSFTVTEDGDYYVIVSINNCNSTQSNIITVTQTKIISSQAIDFMAYPNPVQDFLFVECYENNEKTKLIIWNTLGQILQQIEFYQSAAVDLSMYNDGMYYLQIIGNNINHTIKITKQ